MEAKREFETIRDAVSKVLQIEPDRISMKSRFTEDLGADSLDRMNILIEIEEKLRLEIPYEELRDISTVSDAVEVLVFWEHKN